MIDLAALCGWGEAKCLESFMNIGLPSDVFRPEVCPIVFENSASQFFCLFRPLFRVSSPQYF